jgi:hypothetical protein
MLRLELAGCRLDGQIPTSPKHKGEVERTFATLRLDKRFSQRPHRPPADDTPQARLTPEELEELLLARLPRPSLDEDACYEAV